MRGVGQARHTSFTWVRHPRPWLPSHISWPDHHFYSLALFLMGMSWLSPRRDASPSQGSSVSVCRKKRWGPGDSTEQSQKIGLYPFTFNFEICHVAPSSFPTAVFRQSASASVRHFWFSSCCRRIVWHQVEASILAHLQMDDHNIARCDQQCAPSLSTFSLCHDLISQ